MNTDPPIADFRSDTVTQPTPAMRRAMAEAAVGDDVFGDDPTVAELEREAADLLGKEASLFVPSGTMANQIALHLQASRGTEVLVEANSHIFLYEAGAAPWLTGCQLRPVPSEHGLPSPETVRAMVRPNGDPHQPLTVLLCMENTHNMLGGVAVPVEAMRALRNVANDVGLAVHLDGARLMNAVAATGTPAAEFAACADTVSLCFSKGLGAPVGSVVAGTGEQMARARRIRKVLGGGMRQVGVLAAPALIALREGPEWMQRDQGRAQRLAAGFRQTIDSAGLSDTFTVIPPSTNMVFVAPRTEVGQECAPAITDHLSRAGIRVIYIPGRGWRFVLHHQIDDAMVERCVAAFADGLATLAG